MLKSYHADLGRRHALGYRRRYGGADDPGPPSLEMSATRRPRFRLPGWAWPVIITAVLALAAWGAVRGIPDPVEPGPMMVYTAAGCGSVEGGQ
jgi:hypothetical protein